MIYGIATYVPSAADWLGIDAASYSGAYSAALSILAWSLLTILLIIAWAAVRDFDRAVTRGVSGLYTEALRQLRMAIARFKYRHGPKRRTEPVIEVTEVPDLGLDEIRVLRLHASLGPGYALAVSDVAERLEARGYQVRGLLERLQSLQLLQATVGGLDGESAYTLTPLGRAILNKKVAELKQRSPASQARPIRKASSR
jgi:DNA-binding MarR family transcriptional regulator